MDPRSFAATPAIPSHDKRIALLIDADNVSAKYLKPILDELSKYGTVTIKRIYGDWTLSLHAKWKSALLENSITPIQQFGYTQGKNATDSAMIIDAMDILYANSVESFCIVSSDSDFTRLAARIRESGLTVIGMGEKKTPVPFRMACDVFTTLELLTGGSRRRSSNGKGGTAESTDVPEPIASKQEIEQAVVDIITDNTNNGKATGLGEIGSRLQKRYPDFDVRSYGTNLLSKMLSGFASVKIAKDGSNVSVELADGFSGTVAKVDEVEVPEVETEKVVAEVESETPADGEGDEETRRGRRRRRGRRGGRNLRADADEQVDEAAADGLVEAEEPKTELEQKSEPEPKTEKKPARRSRSRRKAEPELVVDASENVAAEVGTEVEPEKKPAKKRAARRKNATKEDVPAEATQETKESEPVGGLVVDTHEVSDFLATLISDAGEDGIAVGDLSKRVRGRFKDFRVTKTGFRNLRLFVGSIPGVRIDKREDDNYAISE